MNDQLLAGRTLRMSGGSRGIGLAIAVRGASLGATIAFVPKTPIGILESPSQQPME